HGGNYAYALVFATATYECVSEYIFKMDASRKDEMLYYAASSSYLVTKAYIDTAKYKKGLSFYKRVESDFGKYFQMPEFASVQLNAVEMYLGIEEPEIARKIFEKIQSVDIPYYSKINYDRLNSKLASIFRPIHVLPEEAIETESISKTAELKGIEDALQKALAQMGNLDTVESKRLTGVLGELQSKIDSPDEDDKQTLEKTTSVYSIGLEYLKSVGGAGIDVNLMDLRQQLQQNQAIFLNDKIAFDPQSLQTTLQNLQGLLLQFKGKYADDTNDTLWSIQICQKRLGLFAEGAETLEELRENLEHMRSQITDKIQRAGVFKVFQHLFPNLVELHYKSGNTKAVVKAIEASKGRLLADAIEEQTINVIQTDNYELPVDQLPALLLKNKANYLSYFLDDEYSIAVLVTSNGKFYAEKIDMGKLVIEEWVKNRLDDPTEWKNRGSQGFFGMKADIPKLLGQFTNILNIAIADGNLHKDEHLVYSPDDTLFLFPFQYIQFNDKFLIEEFSLSKIHGAYQLSHLLRQPVRKPQRLVCITAPAQQDDAEKVKRFSEVSQWLKKNIDKNLTEQATINQLVCDDYSNSIIHFATHGVFPTPGMEKGQANPYYNSGLLLEKDNNLPELRADFKYALDDNFLNPQKLFSSRARWKNDHISFQACVSSRSKEGVGGDALGMESAAFFCGASSMLTGAWNIPLEWANKFCILFYEYWLKEKLSKANAYKKAMVELLNSKTLKEAPAVYYWAGMTLSGDWR
ncbi:MAG: CHAT domain-containing protein, partial [Chitinophagales bacterium]